MWAWECVSANEPVPELHPSSEQLEAAEGWHFPVQQRSQQLEGKDL